jgi:hypothetical protein
MNRAEIGERALEYEVRGAGEPVVLVHGSHIADAFAPPLNQSTGDWYTYAAIFVLLGSNFLDRRGDCRLIVEL